MCGAGGKEGRDKISSHLPCSTVITWPLLHTPLNVHVYIFPHMEEKYTRCPLACPQLTRRASRQLVPGFHDIQDSRKGGRGEQSQILTSLLHNASFPPTHLPLPSLGRSTTTNTAVANVTATKIESGFLLPSFFWWPTSTPVLDTVNTPA